MRPPASPPCCWRVAIFGAIELSGGGGSSQAVPTGFDLVQAKGRVTHYVVELSGPNAPTTIDLRTGATSARLGTRRSSRWDTKGPLYRVVDRVDGQVTFDLVGNRCIPVTGSARRDALQPGSGV